MQRVISGLDNEITNILNEVEPDIVETQTERLWKGILSDDGNIVPEYTFVTTDIKLRKGQPVDRVTLKDTGDFYNEIYARQHGQEVIIDSSDNKSGKLKEKYGEKIFGLTEPNKVQLKEKTTSKLIDYVKENTGFR